MHQVCFTHFAVLLFGSYTFRISCFLGGLTLDLLGSTTWARNPSLSLLGLLLSFLPLFLCLHFAQHLWFLPQISSAVITSLGLSLPVYSSFHDLLIWSHSLSFSLAPNHSCSSKAKAVGHKHRELLCGVALVAGAGGPGNKWHPPPLMQFSLLSWTLLGTRGRVG